MALLSLGCATSLQRGDDAFRAGLLPDAISHWTRATDVERERPDAVFRLAVLFSVPGTPHYAPDEAKRLLARLPGLDTRGAFGIAAGKVLEFMQMHEKLQARAEELDGRLAGLAEAFKLAQQESVRERARLEQSIVAADDARQQLAAEVQALREELAAIATLREEFERLRSELEALKQIDLAE